MHFAPDDQREIKAYLMREQPADKDLYKHLAKVMNHIVKHCPEDGLNKLEEISYLSKLNDKTVEDKFLKTSVSKAYAAPTDEKTAQVTSALAESTKTLFVSNKLDLTVEQVKKEGGDDGPTAVGNMPDLNEQARIW